MTTLTQSPYLSQPYITASASGITDGRHRIRRRRDDGDPILRKRPLLAMKALLEFPPFRDESHPPIFFSADALFHQPLETLVRSMKDIERILDFVRAPAHLRVKCLAGRDEVKGLATLGIIKEGDTVMCGRFPCRIQRVAGRLALLSEDGRLCRHSIEEFLAEIPSSSTEIVTVAHLHTGEDLLKKFIKEQNTFYRHLLKRVCDSFPRAHLCTVARDSRGVPQFRITAEKITLEERELATYLRISLQEAKLLDGAPAGATHPGVFPGRKSDIFNPFRET